MIANDKFMQRISQEIDEFTSAKKSLKSTLPPTSTLPPKYTPPRTNVSLVSEKQQTNSLTN